MKRIVILGANGQLGSDIRKELSESSELELIPVLRKDLDLERTEKIIPFLKSLGEFHVLINCTAFHNMEQCENDPLKTFAVNSIAVLEMARYCNEHHIIMFHFSTDYVFDGHKTLPYTEEDQKGPLNVYGSSKAAGEQLIQSHHDQYFIFRVSSLFGVGAISGKSGNFVETMLRLSGEGREITVIHDQIMSPTYTKDIAEAVSVFILNNIRDYGIYHCSGEGECSWYDFAVEIFRQCGLAVEVKSISSQQYASKCNRPHYSVLDNSKINRIFPMPSWKSSLHHYLQEKGHLNKGGGQE